MHGCILGSQFCAPPPNWTFHAAAHQHDAIQVQNSGAFIVDVGEAHWLAGKHLCIGLVLFVKAVREELLAIGYAKPGLSLLIQSTFGAEG